MPKPALFIPGYPGTHILERDTGKTVFLNIPGLLHPASKKRILKQLEAPDDLTAVDPLVAGEPIRKLANFLFFDLAKQADSLYNILRTIGIEPVRFGWDWRRPIFDVGMQARLKQAIEDEAQRAQAPVTIIAHSTGGLVARYLLESHKNDAGFLGLIERVIGFGVPWAGTLKSLLFLTGTNGFGPFLTKPETKRVVSLSWAAFDLLPPDPDKTVMEDAQGQNLRLAIDGAGHQVTPLLKRGWFHAGLKERMDLRADAADATLGQRTPSLRLGGHSIPVTNVVGWGAETTVRAVMTGPPDQLDVTFVNEEGDDLQGGGDATVPRVSADWLRGTDVSTYHVPVGRDHGGKTNPHSTLWRNPGGRNLLRHLLSGLPLAPFVYGAVDAEDALRTSVANVRVRLVALDPEADPLSDATVRVTDLQGGPTDTSDFPTAGEGRHLIVIPRNRIRPAGPQHRRFTLEFAWQSQGQTRSLRRSYFVTK